MWGMDAPPGEIRKKVASFVQQSLNRKDSVQVTASQQRQVLEELRVDLLNGVEEEVEEEEQRSQGQGSNNTTMLIGGVSRRIRSNPDHDRLNALVRDVRYSARTAKNHEINRQAKLATLGEEVEALNIERARFSWRAPKWEGGETWRSVNIAKRRANTGDALHRIPPEHRLGALRAIERNTAADLTSWNGSTMRSRMTSPRLAVVSPASTIMPVLEQEYAPSEDSCRRRVPASLAPSPSTCASPRAMGQSPSPKAFQRGSKGLAAEGAPALPSPRRATPTASPK